MYVCVLFELGVFGPCVVLGRPSPHISYFHSLPILLFPSFSNQHVQHHKPAKIGVPSTLVPYASKSNLNSTTPLSMVPSPLPHPYPLSNPRRALNVIVLPPSPYKYMCVPLSSPPLISSASSLSNSTISLPPKNLNPSLSLPRSKFSQEHL